MTPAARYAAAIALLDQIIAGAPAERCLTTWARQNRFAGSKDRAAIRDHVYDVLRAQRSLGAMGGGTDGRALILGLLRREGIPVGDVFGAGGYGPTALSPQEEAMPEIPADDALRCDVPDWLWPAWQASLGAEAIPAGLVQQRRAPVALRVNLRRATVAEVSAALAEAGIATRTVAGAKTALIATENARRVTETVCFRDGWCEMQDVASQMAMARAGVAQGDRVLDFCAGGGGKTLALADLHDATLFAHDAAPARMNDLPVRAARAGTVVKILTAAQIAQQAPFDLVLCDAPCSGSGTWRRTPDAKWRLTDKKLKEYNLLQREVLEVAAPVVRPGGRLEYATCSVLRSENRQIVDDFLLTHPEFSLMDELVLTPQEDHDGFFFAQMRRRHSARIKQN